jgi:hypothetical protein
MKIITVILFLMSFQLINAQNGLHIYYEQKLKQNNYIHKIESYYTLDSIQYSFFTTNLTKRMIEKNWPLGKVFYSHAHYINYKNNTEVFQSHLDSKYKITIQDTFTNYEWEKTMEVKKILGYNCTKYIGDVFKTRFTIWSTSDSAYIGMPNLSFKKGLVLAYSTNDYEVIATKIEHKEIVFAEMKSEYILNKKQFQKSLETRQVKIE